jgi:hypothetical protein
MDKESDEMKSKLKTFEEEIKQKLKLEDLATDGDKPDPHQWTVLVDSDPDFREEFFKFSKTMMSGRQIPCRPLKYPISNS